MGKPSKIHDPDGYRRAENAEFFDLICWIAGIAVGSVILIGLIFG